MLVVGGVSVYLDLQADGGGGVCGVHEGLAVGHEAVVREDERRPRLLVHRVAALLQAPRCTQVGLIN